MNITELAIYKKMFGGGTGGGGSTQEQSGIVGVSWEKLVNDGYIHINDGVLATNYDEDSDYNSSREVLVGNLVLPADKGITEIGESAFMMCERLFSVVLPNGITAIDNYAFSCTRLESIEIPTSIKSIGEGAFSGLQFLRSVIFASNSELETIGAWAFADTSINSDEEDFKIPSGVKYIGDNAFSGCWGIRNIIFEGTVAQWNAIDFGENCFRGTNATYVQCTDGTVSLLLTFTVTCEGVSTTYQAKQGMTWREWLDDYNYNTNGYRWATDGYRDWLIDDSGHEVRLPNGCYIDEFIINGESLYCDTQ